MLKQGVTILFQTHVSPTVTKLGELRVPANCLGCCNGLGICLLSLILSLLGKHFCPPDQPVRTTVLSNSG